MLVEIETNKTKKEDKNLLGDGFGMLGDGVGAIGSLGAGAVFGAANLTANIAKKGMDVTKSTITNTSDFVTQDKKIKEVLKDESIVSPDSGLKH